MSGVLRAFTIGLTAFLTVVDLFATQAILPALTRAYGVTPAQMGFAVNATTIGMAAGGTVILLSPRRVAARAAAGARARTARAASPYSLTFGRRSSTIRPHRDSCP